MILFVECFQILDDHRINEITCLDLIGGVDIEQFLEFGVNKVCTFKAGELLGKPAAKLALVFGQDGVAMKFAGAARQQDRQPVKHGACMFARFFCEFDFGELDTDILVLSGEEIFGIVAGIFGNNLRRLHRLHRDFTFHIIAEIAKQAGNVRQNVPLIGARILTFGLCHPCPEPAKPERR